MARTVNPEEHASKRNQILDAAQRLVYSKGYEQMTIQDILNELRMSSGAFYHYFKTKPAVLEALIARMQQEVEAALLPIVEDASLSALEKLQRFFATLEHSSTTYNPFIADLLRVWLTDDNAIVREKTYNAMRERRAPLLRFVVRQGVQEGVFATPFPEQVAEVMLALARGMGDSLAQQMLTLQQVQDKQPIIDQIVAIYAAYADALERVLGAPSGFLHRPTVDAAAAWMSPSQEA